MNTAIITGASSGIGKAIALELSKHVKHIVINSLRHPDLLQTTHDLIIANGVDCLSIVGDICDYDFTKSLVNTTYDNFGSIDVLINNAGISYIGLLTDMSYLDWRNIIDTNLTSVFNTCNQVVPYMVSQNSGHIINISSIWGNNGASCEVAYSASKGGMNAFTKSLAKELAPSNIRVNAVACGVIDTHMNQCFSPEEMSDLMDTIPLGRLGTPEEVALFVQTLIQSPGYLTGQVITLDGGYI